MKKNPLLLVLLCAFTLAVSSCNNDDDAPAPPPVVGVWELDRLEISDMPAPYSNFNGTGYDNYLLFAQASRLDIQSDRSFDEVYKTNGTVLDFDGTWEFNGTSNELDLNYTDTDIDDITLTYDPAKMRLYGEKSSLSDSLRNPTTNRRELVRFSIQQVYIKQ